MLLNAKTPSALLKKVKSWSGEERTATAKYVNIEDFIFIM